MTNTLTVTSQSDVDITVSRRFGAPRRRVFDAFTKPELVRKWMHGPNGWNLERCELDLRVGGQIRYEWRNAAGDSMGMSGEFREIDTPHRTVHTELFDEDWTGGETLVTTSFGDTPDGTIVTITTRFGSTSARDAALESGMAEGMEQSFANLERTLAE